MKILRATVAIVTLLIFTISCKKDDSDATILQSKAIFTCKIDGKEFITPIQEFNTNQVRTAVSKAYIVGADNSEFNVSLNIPYETPIGSEITNFETILTDHSDGYTYISESLENPKLVVTQKRKGFISGTFSFTTSKGGGSKKFVVTDGKFETNILYDE